ncbi:MAG: DUF2288 domain-containing protein [Kangiellaceae bacterium]|nr:DUF2288 domain-containing protein [Kangiellaceae bacterium]
MTEQLSTQQKLNLETATVEWKDLQVFFAQGKLLVVEPEADLLEVASSIAENNIGLLEKMIEEHKIAFATANWVNANCQEQTLLWTVVVSPYVVTQLQID